MTSIIKQLSSNDVGTTGGHQAGILVPKDPHVLGFFPELSPKVKNPRAKVVVREAANGARWEFSFIYYNNRLFGGTRNEYRLTCMTGFLRSINAQEGDELVFRKDSNGSIEVALRRQNRAIAQQRDDGVLVLGGGWKYINL